MMTGNKNNHRSEFTVRQYNGDDYPFVKLLWEETDLGNPKRGDDENIISQTISMGGCLLLLEEKKTGKICGTSWMTFDGRRIMLHHFGISPAYQGRGFADFLLEESLKFVKSKNYQVKLEVHESNIRAVELYKKHGFQYLGDYDVYIIRDLSGI
jgi:ribosomal protein S18 acetylase RimI-like enzyme